MPVRTAFEYINTPPGEEIVIGGISGAYANSSNIHELKENLYNKIDMITENTKSTHPDIPKRFGRMKNVEKFDANYFNIPENETNTMDPTSRLFLEKAYEAVIDAGFHPEDLKGTNTGVYAGVSFSETEKLWFLSKDKVDGTGILGCSRALLANRVSYYLDLKGPSYNVDTACSSSLYALEHAYRNLKSGLCDMAIVGTSQLCLVDIITLQFFRLGVLSREGRCRPFDEDADGYVRSEAVVCVVLMKAKDAKRIYSYIEHIKTNCDGYKSQGITYPSSEKQKLLFKEFYSECSMNPNTLTYLECHGTATRAGDLEETRSIDEVFCQNRTKPLKIGSVKSNLGHSEPASGLCSISKCILIFETGLIPPNLNYKTPRKEIEGLTKGRFEVVTEVTKFEDDYIGVNGFGFGGANCHLLMKRNSKEKVNNGIPQDDLPRLVVFSGRTKSALDAILTSLESNALDAEYVRLYHDIFRKNIKDHSYRGYALIQKNDPRLIASDRRCLTYYEKRPIWFAFSGIGSQWVGMGASMMKIPIFAETIRKLNKHLERFDINISELITNTDNGQLFDNVLYAFVGITAIQIALVDTLEAIGIQPDHIIGYSTGELICAYVDNCLTAEQTILIAYYRGLVLLESKLVKGSMAVCDINSNELSGLCSPKVEVIGRIDKKSSIISGPTDDIKETISQLTSKGISTQELNTSNIAFHSRYIHNIEPRLRKEFRKFIANPRARSRKWISTTKSGNKYDDDFEKYCSAEYLADNLRSEISFEEGLENIESNAIIIEIAPDNLLANILRKTITKNVYITSLMQRGENNINPFLNSLGQLYLKGVNFQLANIYPKIDYPVSRATPMISPYIKWDHSKDWYVLTDDSSGEEQTCEKEYLIRLKDPKYQTISGHIIDGRNLYPATGYLVLVWELLAEMYNELLENLSVIFEDLRFIRATNVPKEDLLKMSVMIQRATGNFEIEESGSTVVSGRIRRVKNDNKHLIKLPPVDPVISAELLPLGSRDVYKELRLRGYNYQGDFKGILFCDNDANVAEIQWDQNNWIAFMDNMLQVQILQETSRQLCVPTSIQQLTIYPQEHIKHIKACSENKESITVTNYKKYNIIQGGGIEIRGLQAVSINRRKPLGDPVLEKQIFVPFITQQQYSLNDALRIILQVALENNPSIKVKAVEVDNGKSDLLAPVIHLVLGDLPLIQAEIVVLSKRTFDLPKNVVTADKNLSSESNALFVINSNLINQSDALLQSSKVLKNDEGFLISRENPKIKPNSLEEYDTLVEVFVENEKLVLLRKKKKNIVTPEIIRITTDTKFSWLETTKKILQNNKPVIFYSQHEATNGLIGFLNCIKKEPSGSFVRGVFIEDSRAPEFDIKHPFYKKQLSKGLFINIYKNGKWGTLRHLEIAHSKIDSSTAFAYNVVSGDLSSLRWVELPPPSQEKKRLEIYYSALNFRDVMLATGKLRHDFICQDMTNFQLPKDCVQGFEFVGRDREGKRYMGIVARGALATCVDADQDLLWPVPDNWTMEEAATVPIVYSTVYYAFVLNGLKKGHKVLIHSGTGGVGQAAINVALYYNCEIFTTVGTPEKRKFIKELFPQIKDSHIGNSRDTTFEQMVMRETNGKGVDFVLNSLAEEKLLASVRCLGEYGKFLEIGKYDLGQNNKLDMEVFMRGISFHGIMLDNVIGTKTVPIKRIIYNLLLKGVADGAVKPLKRTIFNKNELEKAYRFMAAGHHMGKVLIKIKDEEPELITPPPKTILPTIPRVYCDLRKSYIIIGGLGGFGLELADWLIQRGCRNLILSSRNGLTKGYQAMRIRKWKHNEINVQISKANVATKQGCTEIIKLANTLGKVDAIYNLAVVLRDALIENQTIDNFQASCAGKALGTQYLDEVSRKLCPELRYFVVFSSVSCGRGNAGQSNYGMANSIMERICEKRKVEGYPALAIQWGAVGDVGLIADMQDNNKFLEVSGTLQQRLDSCLEVMDILMRQEAPVVSSMVVAEKKFGFGVGGNLVETVSNILGLRDMKTVSKHSTLAELGMDSMMAVEIKQTLEREFELFLNAPEIRNLTLARLEEIQISKSGEETKINSTDIFKMLVQTLGNEDESFETLVKLKSHDQNRPPLFFFAGIEGQSSVFEPLCQKLSHTTYGLQISFTNKIEDIQILASHLLTSIKSKINPTEEYNIVAYSFGSLIAMEVVSQLEKEGYKGKILFLDGAPLFIKTLVTNHLMLTEDLPEAEIEIKLLLMTLILFNSESLSELKTELESLPNWESRVDLLISKLPPNATPYSKDYQRIICNGLLARLKSIIKYNIEENQFKLHSDTKILLIRPKTPVLSDCKEDYELSSYVTNSSNVAVQYVDGDHRTFLNNPELSNIVNDFF